MEQSGEIHQIEINSIHYLTIRNGRVETIETDESVRNSEQDATYTRTQFGPRPQFLIQSSNSKMNIFELFRVVRNYLEDLDTCHCPPDHGHQDGRVDGDADQIHHIQSGQQNAQA